MDADTYQRAADVENLRGSTVPRGRALAGGDLAQLFGACTADATPKGTRDAAMLSVFYGCGVRRGELARLDVDDFRPEDCSIIVRHGKRHKQRTVYLSECGCRHVKAWLGDRGDMPGPLFCPVSQTGDVRIRPLRGESIAYILRRRQEQAGSAPFSPHDLRRYPDHRIIPVTRWRAFSTGRIPDSDAHRTRDNHRLSRKVRSASPGR